MTKQLTLKSAIQNSRPLWWPLTALSFVSGYMLGHPSISWVLFAGLVYFTLPYNLLRAGLDRGFDRLAQIAIGLSITFGAYFFIIGSRTSCIILGLLLIIAVGDSVPPLRFRSIPIVDGLSFALQLVLPLLFGLALGEAQSWYWPAVISFVVWGFGSYALSTIPTLSHKRSLTERSIATIFGTRLTALISLWFYLASALVVAVSYAPAGILAGGLMGFYVLNVSFFLKYRSDAKSGQFARAWRNSLALNYIVGGWLVLLLLFTLDPWHLGMARATSLAELLIAIAIAQTLLIIHNLAGFARPKNHRLSDYPKASILIHAYNQADNIASTMLAALGQNYPDYEIVFADLGSTDNTANIVASYQDERLREIQIKPTPNDWSLNSWASQQLLEHAKGEVVVLLSADTVLLPDTLGIITSLLFEQELDIVSLLPADQNKTLSQRLLLSLNRYFRLGLYPAAYLNKNFPRLAAASSGLMGFSRSALERINGFESVKRSPLEDLDLAAEAKQRNLRTGFYLGSELATMQNHASLRLIVLQNIQRFYPSLRFSYPLAVAMITGGLFVLVLPLPIFVFELAQGHTHLAILFGLGLIMNVVNRLIIAATSRQSYVATIFYPLTSFVALLLVLVSMLQYELFKPRWQNRTEL